MGKECRAHVHGDTNRPGTDAEIPAGSRAPHRLTIGELAREAGVSLRALRFYQSKGLLAPRRRGCVRVFTEQDRDCLTLILQGKRLGFTLTEIREMLQVQGRGCVRTLPINRTKCIEQINMLERQRRDIDRAIAELRAIYTEMFVALRGSRSGDTSATG